jgi:hypothetical protein
MDMEIKRLDHLGIIAGVIKELELVKAIDSPHIKLPPKLKSIFS